MRVSDTASDFIFDKFNLPNDQRVLIGRGIFAIALAAIAV